MAVKRKTYTFRKGDVIEVEEFHDGNYGAPGSRRGSRRKATAEQMALVNRYNKAKRCRHRLLQYFNSGDLFATLTYEKTNRPADMDAAKKDFRKAMRSVRKEYKKLGIILRWIANIERGTKGAWHIHLVIKEAGNTASILKKAWNLGGIYAEQIALNNKLYDVDFTKLACYMTKDENTTEKKLDGSRSKPRLSEAAYSTSRNMPLAEPKIDRIMRWKEKIKPKKGYSIEKEFHGYNPVTGFMYRRYTMIRLRI